MSSLPPPPPHSPDDEVVGEGGDGVDASSTQTWQQCYDESSGYFYYMDVETGESTWDEPSQYLPYDPNTASIDGSGAVGAVGAVGAAADGDDGWGTGTADAGGDWGTGYPSSDDAPGGASDTDTSSSSSEGDGFADDDDDDDDDDWGTGGEDETLLKSASYHTPSTRPLPSTKLASPAPTPPADAKLMSPSAALPPRPPGAHPRRVRFNPSVTVATIPDPQSAPRTIESAAPTILAPAAATPPLPVSPSSSSSPRSFASSSSAASATAPSSSTFLTPNRVFCLYGLQFRVHACCCEGTASLVQSLVLSPSYFVFGLVALGLSYTSVPGQWRHRAAAWLREGLIYAASALSLLVPFMILRVYRRFSVQADTWRLAPLPTIIGDVDPRRFCAITSGNGSWSQEGEATAGAVGSSSLSSPTSNSYTMDNVWDPFSSCLVSAMFRFHAAGRDGAFGAHADDAMEAQSNAEDKYNA